MYIKVSEYTNKDVNTDVNGTRKAARNSAVYSHSLLL